MNEVNLVILPIHLVLLILYILKDGVLQETSISSNISVSLTLVRICEIFLMVIKLMNHIQVYEDLGRLV